MVTNDGVVLDADDSHPEGGCPQVGVAVLAMVQRVSGLAPFFPERCSLGLAQYSQRTHARGVVPDLTEFGEADIYRRWIG